MPSKNSTPIGYVELPNGSLPIYPMNDIFLAFTFEDVTHWEALRLVVNIIIDAYKLKNPNSYVAPIKGNIKVRTQFKHLLAADGKTTRDQDIKIIDDENEESYIEFQNKATTVPPIAIRSVEYFGLGIGHSKGKTANQIWLLAEDVDSVLHGESITRYILKDEVTNDIHPTASGIMYVSLTRLSQEKNSAGELAAFLLGKVSTPESDDVKLISGAFEASFEEFKNNKEVSKMLTLAERYTDAGRVEGEARGRIEGVNKLAELIRSGLSLEDALQKINEESCEQV